MRSKRRFPKRYLEKATREFPAPHSPAPSALRPSYLLGENLSHNSKKAKIKLKIKLKITIKALFFIRKAPIFVIKNRKAKKENSSSMGGGFESLRPWPGRPSHLQKQTDRILKILRVSHEEKSTPPQNLPSLRTKSHWL